MQSVGLVGFSNKGGGASRALGRWQKLLQLSSELHCESFLFYENEFEESSRFTTLIDHKLASISSRYQVKVGKKFCLTDGGHMSLNLLPTFYGRNLRNKKVDFFNIHWVQAEMISINQLAKIPQPIVWSLHDPWLINGMGHYIQENQGGAVGAVHNMLDRWTQSRKKVLIRGKDKFIAPSEWIAKEFIEFGISPDAITIIPNPLDFKTFFPRDKDSAKKKYTLDPHKLVILFGVAADLKDRRKGYDLGIQLLERVSSDIDIELITFGHDTTNIKLPFKRTHVGYIDNDNELADLYSAADITLLPSRIDNLPQVMTESIACGTPVFAFPEGGPRSVITREFGVVATSFNIERAAFDFVHMATNIQNYRPKELAHKAQLLWNEGQILKKFERFVQNYS